MDPKQTLVSLYTVCLSIIRWLHAMCWSAIDATGSTSRTRSLLIICGACRANTKYAHSLQASQQWILRPRRTLKNGRLVRNFHALQLSALMTAFDLWQVRQKLYGKSFYARESYIDLLASEL